MNENTLYLDCDTIQGRIKITFPIPTDKTRGKKILIEGVSEVPNGGAVDAGSRSISFKYVTPLTKAKTS